MPWDQALPSILCVAAAVFVPGYGLWRVLRVSRSWSLFLSPIGSAATVGGLAMILGLVRIPWHWISVSLGTVLVWAIAYGLGRLVRHTRVGRSGSTALSHAAAARRVPWQGVLYVLAATVLGGSLIASRLAQAIPSAESFPQRFDAIYHINALHYILETGNASSLSLGTMVYSDSRFSFYPALWHGLGSLAITATGQSVFVATLAVLFVACAVLWPLSIVVLTGSVVGFRPLPLAAAGLGAASMSAFPFAIINFGPLLPNILSLAMLPLALAIVAGVLGVTRLFPTSGFLTTVLLVATVGALGVAQPNSIATLVVTAVIIVACQQAHRVRCALDANTATYHRKLVWRGAMVLGLILALVGLWYLLQTGYDHQAEAKLTAAAGEGLLLAPNGREEIPWVFTVGMLLGLVTAMWRRRYVWLVIAHIVTVVFYVYAAGAPDSPFRTWLVGPWYEDTYRLAALLPMFAIVLTGVFVTAVIDVIFPHAALRPALRRWRDVVELVLAVVLGFVLVAPTQDKPFEVTDQDLHWAFGWQGEPLVLSHDEYELIKRVDSLVPPDALIGVNPWNGSGMAYSLADREVTSRHIYTQLTPAEATVATELDKPQDSAQACAAVRESGIDYILDFGTDYVLRGHPGGSHFPAFTDVQDQPHDHYQQIARVGEKVLYKVVGCGN